MAGALAQHAEETLQRIGVEHESVVREYFRNLVTAQGTRAIIDWDELLSVAPDRAVGEAVLRDLVDARLLTSYEVATALGRPEHHRVEVAHESLLTAWPRLVRWRTQDEEGAQLRDQLKQAAHLWDEKGRTADLLWSGTAFREYSLWRERHVSALTSVEEAFAAAMTDKARRRRRLLIAGVATAFVLLAAFSALIARSRMQAMESARQAETEAQHAEASKLVALGRLELARYPTAAVAYALKSLETSDTTEARLLALEALWQAPPARVLPLPEGVSCTRVAFAGDGRSLACAGYAARIALWHEDDPAPRVLGPLPVKADSRGIAFDATGRRLLSWLPGDPSLRSWPLDGGTPDAFDASAEWLQPTTAAKVVTLGPLDGGRTRVLREWSLDHGGVREIARWTPPTGLRLDQPGLRPVAFDGALRWLAFGDGADVVLRALARGGPPNRVLGRHDARLREVDFDPAGRQLVSLDESGRFCIWSMSDGGLVRGDHGGDAASVSRPVFGPDGASLAWTSGDGATYLWEFGHPVDLPPLALRRADVRDAGDEAFDPQGRWLASAGWASVALWPLQAHHVHVLRGHVEGPLMDLAFSNDSRWLASCARDGAFLWPLNPSMGGRRRIDLGGDYYCYSVAFEPGGGHVLVSSPYVGTFLVPIGGGTARRVVDFTNRRAAPGSLALDSRARTLAVAPMYAAADDDMVLDLVDLVSGSRRRVPLREPGSGDGYRRREVPSSTSPMGA